MRASCPTLPKRLVAFHNTAKSPCRPGRSFMTSSAAKIHVGFAILTMASMALFLAGCGPTKPPADDLGIAARNLTAARSAGAANYAPQELRTAEQGLAAANAAVAKHDYDEATVLAEESSVNSELAAAKSRLGKAREANDNLRRQNADLEREAARHAEGGSQP